MVRPPTAYQQAARHLEVVWGCCKPLQRWLHGVDRRSATRSQSIQIGLFPPKKRKNQHKRLKYAIIRRGISLKPPCAIFIKE
jgi:hypothetical protein